MFGYEASAREAGGAPPKGILKNTCWRYVDFMRLYRGLSGQEIEDSYVTLSRADGLLIDQCVIDFQEEAGKEATARGLRFRDIIAEFKVRAESAGLPSATGVDPLARRDRVGRAGGGRGRGGRGHGRWGRHRRSRGGGWGGWGPWWPAWCGPYEDCWRDDLDDIDDLDDESLGDSQQDFLDRVSSKQPLGDFTQQYMSDTERAVLGPFVFGQSGTPDLLLILVSPR
jgi:hypothetical protein